MLRTLTSRLLASACLAVVGLGGGGLPVLDALVFHGPSRVAESFRTHWEAGSDCHGDGCSVRVMPDSRFFAPKALVAPPAVAVSVVPEPAPRLLPAAVSELPLHLSRAPPAIV